MPDTGLASFWSGREDEPSTKKAFGAFEQEPDFSEPTPEKAPTPQAPKSEKPGQPAPQKAAEPEQRGTFSVVAPESVSVGSQFDVEIKVADVKNLYSAPFTLTYDPIFLEFVTIAEGAFLTQDNKPVELSTQHDPAQGTVIVAHSRAGKVEGVNGTGTLLKATFKAKNIGPGSIGLQNIDFAAPDGKLLQIVPYNATVDIRPPALQSPQEAPRQGEPAPQVPSPQ
jgi:general secretion pathway protein D